MPKEMSEHKKKLIQKIKDIRSGKIKNPMSRERAEYWSLPKGASIFTNPKEKTE